MRSPRCRAGRDCAEAGVSRRAIAALLAREDLASGERLVAFSLASFADRQNRAWPGAPAAAQRAGLSRSRYLQARDRLVRHGLVVVEDAASGRGRSTTLGLVFAAAGPWWDGEVNAEICEAVLSYSRTRGPARLLLAAMAALSSERGELEDLTTERLCSAEGLANRSYRRARRELLASGELILISGVGGRGNTNRWEITDPRLIASDGRWQAATHGRRRGTSPIHISDAARRGSDARPRAQRLGRHRCAKRRSGSDTFCAQPSHPDRGFRRKGRSGTDAFAGL
jgi:hypothetical protein